MWKSISRKSSTALRISCGTLNFKIGEQLLLFKDVGFILCRCLLNISAASNAYSWAYKCHNDPPRNPPDGFLYIVVTFPKPKARPDLAWNACKMPLIYSKKSNKIVWTVESARSASLCEITQLMLISLAPWEIILNHIVSMRAYQRKRSHHTQY
jgi:hypothetical protein